jgi:hypothetical protein
MPTDVEDILSAARALPKGKQIEILRRLLESLAGGASELEAASLRFWASRTIEDLAEEHGTPTITDIHTLAFPEWPVDDRVDDMIAYLREQRYADRGA